MAFVIFFNSCAYSLSVLFPAGLNFKAVYGHHRLVVLKLCAVRSALFLLSCRFLKFLLGAFRGCHFAVCWCFKVIGLRNTFFAVDPGVPYSSGRVVMH
jgi:hypothetical protein